MPQKLAPHKSSAMRGKPDIGVTGELIFSTFESVIRAGLKHAPYCKYLILDLRNVVNIDAVALKLLPQFNVSLQAQGVKLLLCNASKFYKAISKVAQDEIKIVDDEDEALECCENGLLAEKFGDAWHVKQPVKLSENYLLSDLDENELYWMEKNMSAYQAKKGDYLIQAGDLSDSLYLLETGSVLVQLPTESGVLGKRIDVYAAGMFLGEMGFLDGAPRSAHVIALEDLSYRVIDIALYHRLETELPTAKIKLLEKMALQLSSSLRRSNAEIKAYKG